MGTISLSGTLTAGPTTAAAIPGGTGSFPIATSPDPKSFSVSANGVKLLASPGSFQTLAGVGSGQDVNGASFLYLKTNGPVAVRLTQVGGTAMTLQIQGTLMLEFPSTALLTLVEVQGTATVEYFASGDA